MRALIHQIDQCRGAGLLPIAGQPLLIRQLQWLRSLGCEQVAVELDASPECQELARLLEREQALSLAVIPVLSARPLGPSEVARRAGLALEGTLAIAADTLVSVDPRRALQRAQTLPARALLPAPCDACHGPASVTLLGSAPAGRICTVPCEGWGVRVRDATDALAATSAVLRHVTKQKGSVWTPQVHAAEVEPGVWIARGAHVDARAVLRAPVLIGPEAYVAADAELGPNVVLGERAVIERGARLEACIVEPSTIVGGRLVASAARLGPGSARTLESDATVPVEDRGLLDARALAGEVRFGASLASLLLLCVTLPVALPLFYLRRLAGRRDALRRVAGPLGTCIDADTGVAALDLVPRLFDVLRGRRALVGPRFGAAHVDCADPALLSEARQVRLGALGIDDALGRGAESAEDLLRARAWYAHGKGALADARLLWWSLRRPGAVPS